MLINKNQQTKQNNQLQTMQSSQNIPLSLIYHPKIDNQKNYLFKADAKFIQQLIDNQEMVISGQSNDQLILNLPTNSYKLKGIHLSTTLLIIQQNGTIHKQTQSYLQLQKFNPYYHEIYNKLINYSCTIPNKQQINNYNQLVEKYSFSQDDVRKWGYLGEREFNILKNAMGLLEVQNMEMGECIDRRYLYIGLQFRVWIIRQIILTYNQNKINLIQSIPVSELLRRIPIINTSILSHIAKLYQITIQQNPNQPESSTIKLTPKSIIRFIFSQMAIAKKQFSTYTFEEVLDQMLLIYMPAQIQITSTQFKDNKNLKQKDKLFEQMWNCRYDYFIDVKGQKYVVYDYMEIQTDISARIKYLSGFKNRWKSIQLKAIFRGVDSTQDSKYLTLSDVLLKKFRKFGDQYQIKFVLPNK